jgi:hypothetical protein
VNRDPAVDRWLDGADGPPAEMMRRARDIILGADGRVTESIKQISTGSRPAEPSWRPSSEPGATGRRGRQDGAELGLPGLFDRQSIGPSLPARRLPHVLADRTSRSLAAKASGWPLWPYSPPRKPPWLLGKTTGLVPSRSATP